MVWCSISQRHTGPSTVVFCILMVYMMFHFSEVCQTKYCGTGSTIPWDPPRPVGAQWAAKSRQKWSHTNICSLGPFCRKYRNTKWRNTNCKKSGYIRTYILGRVLTEIQKWSQTFLHRLTVKWIRITPKTIYQVAVMDRLWLPVEVVMLFWSLGVQVTK